MQGEAAAGVAPLRQALASPDAGPESLRSYWLAALAEVYGRAGQPQAGLQVLAEAVTLMATTEMRCWETEVSRLHGELLLQLPSPDVPRRNRAGAIAIRPRRQAVGEAPCRLPFLNQWHFLENPYLTLGFSRILSLS